MMKKYITVTLLSLAAFTSCIEGPSGISTDKDGNALRVRFNTQELIVKSEAQDFYAYIPSELLSGNVNSIGYSYIDGEGYYLYNLPETATEAIFSNIKGGNEYIALSYDEDQKTTFTLTGHPLFDDEILYGKISDLAESASHKVEMKRLTATLSHYLKMVDSNGQSLPTDNIRTVDVTYPELGKSVTIDNDGNVTVTPKGGNFGFASCIEQDGHIFTKCIIPTADTRTIQVSINFTDDTKKEYTKELPKVLEANHHYTITLRLKKLNSEIGFELEEPIVETVSNYPGFNKTEVFSISGGRVVGGAANDKTILTVNTIVPYDWTFDVVTGGEFFDVAIVDGKLEVTAKTDNINEVRSATIVLSTTEGHTKEITVNQKTSVRHKIVMQSQHTSTYTTFTITGENISVQGPQDAAPVKYEGWVENKKLEINGLSTGATIIIEGDIITQFKCAGTDNSTTIDDYGYTYDYYSQEQGYYYSNYTRKSFGYTFDNCVYLEDLVIQGGDPSIDVSGMPCLKRLYIRNNPNLTEIKFADNSRLEHLGLYYCEAITGIDFSKIASTIKTVNLYDSNKLTGVQLINCSKLEYLNVNSCGAMKVINMTGCTSIEDLSIYSITGSNLNLTNCSALKNLTLQNITLDKIITTGADNLETVTTSSVTISNVNFAGKGKLKSLGVMSGVTSLDISDCSALSDIEMNFSSSATEQTVNISGTQLKNVSFKYLNTNLDFTALTECTKLYIIDAYRKITGMDLSECTLLEDLYIDFSDYGSETMQSLKLPASLKRLNLSYLYYYPGCLNLSNLKKLEELDIYYMYTMTELDLSGCTVLKSVNRDDAGNSYDGQNSSNTRCPYIEKVTLTDCPALEQFRMSNAKIKSLDFSSSPLMFELDVRSNSMDEAALTSMFNSLPDRSASYQSGTYKIDGNPGATTAVKDLANDKGWF